MDNPELDYSCVSLNIHTNIFAWQLKMIIRSKDDNANIYTQQSNKEQHQLIQPTTITSLRCF